MKRSKVLLILDDSIINNHHGVRRYVLSLANGIASSLDLDYVVQRKNAGLTLYYRIIFSESFIINNGFFDDNLVGKSRNDIIKKIHSRHYLDTYNKFRAYYTCSFLGAEIPDEYSLVIVSAPWIHINKYNFSCLAACIGLDAIPNIYTLYNIDDHGLQEFAWRHKFGFEYYDLILSISDESKTQISYFIDDVDKVVSIPPFTPAGFEPIKINQFRRNERKTIILAAPFDERKGVAFMPELINKSDIEEIIIFGSVRCSVDVLLNFFENIAVDKIEWWSSVTTHKQIELYQRAHALLFPSLHEGLGLPVLESLACNTPAIVSNIKPLNQLVDPPFIIDIKEQLSKNVSIINGVLSISESYSAKNEAFSPRNLTNFITNLINTPREKYE
ncbi:TPA: glycosyltransferase family 4 protein [Yersinia enterocolitica]|nr:glycosyltransferase family 4 protein [Yersinia enterocolitica]